VHEELMAVVTIIIIRRMADFSSHLLFLPLAKYVLATAGKPITVDAYFSC
jgi:hypothetical protein